MATEWETRRRVLDEFEKELLRPRRLPVSWEKLEDENVPVLRRDYCAHLLIPLNECRKRNFYLMWRCGEERDAYGRCQFQERIIRVKFAFLERERRKLEEDAKGLQLEESKEIE